MIQSAAPLQFSKEKAPPEAVPAQFGPANNKGGSVGLSKVRYYNTKEAGPEAEILELGLRQSSIAQISPAGIVFYTKRPGRAKDPDQVYNVQNLTPGLKTKHFSASAARRVRQIAAEWAEMTNVNYKNKGGRAPQFGFWTFTLPAKQGYEFQDGEWIEPENGQNSDQAIKRSVLNTVLQYIRRKGANYLWRAETQANGNIHFHVLVDKYLNFNELRLRYIDAIDKHTTLTDHYKDPFDEWTNGVDVEAVKDLDAIGGYMAKYFSKDDPDNLRRPVSGKQWGASSALKLLKSPAIHRECSRKGYEIISEAARAAFVAGNYCKFGDYFTFVSVSPRELEIIAPRAARYVSRYRGAYYRAAFAKNADLWEIYRLRSLIDPAMKARPPAWEGLNKVDIYEFCKANSIKSLAGVNLPRKNSNNEAPGALQKSKPHFRIDSAANKSKPSFCGVMATGGDRKPGGAFSSAQTVLNL